MGTWTFGYDGLNRLSSGTPSTGPYSAPQQHLCMNYDSFGNRTQSSLQTTACQPTTDPATARYNAANQVIFTTVNAAATGFTYDKAGNVLNDNAHFYAYDNDGRLCAVQDNPISGGAEAFGYIYNAEGQRVAKGTITPSPNPATQPPSCNPATNGFSLTESYVLGQSGEQLTTLDQNQKWVRTNVYGSGAQLATYDTAGLHFQLTDPLGTRRVQTNALGEVELNCQSLPSGDEMNCGSPNSAPSTADGATPLHFTGKERDTESGNDYFGARYYASSMGRWMSPDWSAIPVGVPYASMSDRQSLNLYAYVGNNPLSHRDSDGHHQECGGTTMSTNAHGDTVVNANCHDVPDWWQFQGARRWLGNHPKTVKTVGNITIGLTVISGLADGGASELAVPEEIAAEEALIEAGELAAEEEAEAAGVESAANAANKATHIFDKAKHNLDGVVNALGGKTQAFEALQKATSEATQGLSGQFKTVVQLGGQSVTVEGAVVNGAARIGTAYIP